MGILTRRQGDWFIISSDHIGDDLRSKRPPPRRDDAYQVWTGARWSPNVGEGMAFASLDEADGYVKANYAKISGEEGELKTRGR